LGLNIKFVLATRDCRFRFS